MKRILALALIATLWGGVTLKAETVKKRFVVRDELSWGSVNIYLYKDENNKYTGDWPGMAMTEFATDSDGKKWFETWLDLDENILSEVKVIFNGNNQQTADANSFDISSNDFCFYVYEENNVIKYSNVAIDYYLVDNSDSGIGTKLTYDFSSQTCTGTIQNQSSPADTYYVFAPNYALTDDHNSVNSQRWNLVYRPSGAQNDYELSSFSTYNTNLSVGGDGKIFKVTTGAVANFDITVNVKEKNFRATPYISKTIANNDKKLGTFSAPGAVTIPEGVTAYIGKLNEAKTGIDMVEVNGVLPADQGILYTGETVGAEVKFYATTESSSANFDGNVLTPTGASADLSAGDYVLATVNNADLGFYPLSTAASGYGPYKAYIKKESVSGGSAKLAINFGDETAIQNIADTTENNVFFDLQGRRVEQPTKGVFIVNGKKVIL